MLWRIRDRMSRSIRHGVEPWFQPWLRRSLRRELLDQELETLKPLMTGRVLEIGAGRIRRRGDFLPPVESVSAWVLVDISSVTRPHLCADVGCLPFGAGAFDTVICLEMLEYVPDPVGALREMRRILRPGGRLILATPFLHRWDTPTDLWRFTAPGLVRIVTLAGWRVETLRVQGGILAVLNNIVRHLLVKHAKGWRWWLMALIFTPLQRWLIRMDPIVTARSPTFATFTTGLILVADNPLANLTRDDDL
ncbi:hypothetical protein SIID45300_01719 [Candidatus Magnetaquicoccaceae bacterium FCR-1]|uniref:Methyltransferase type 11 domain-containing protein n=1 Tax=Candidatus Magnetaquiglobus chichijimensis TaxID=3141448 RepID=A0ABQ0C932_9PROT